MALVLAACRTDPILLLPTDDAIRSYVIVLERPTSIDFVSVDVGFEPGLARTEDVSRITILGYPFPLAELQLEDIHIATQAPTRTLPTNARYWVSLDGGALSEVDALPGEVARLRISAFDPQICSEAGGCFGEESDERCVLPCPRFEVERPEMPLAPATVPPTFSTDCPPGWRLGDRGRFAMCLPPTLPMNIPCPPGNARRAFATECSRVGPACSADSPWPAPLPAGPILFVDAASTDGDGSVSRPLSNLGDALAVATASTTIVFAKGSYPSNFLIEQPISLLGACSEETLMLGELRVRSNVRIAQVGIVGSQLVVEHGGQAQVTGVEFSGPAQGGIVAANSQVDLRDSLIRDRVISVSATASTIAIALSVLTGFSTGVHALRGTALSIRDTELRASAPGARAVLLSDRSRGELDHSVVEAGLGIALILESRGWVRGLKLVATGTGATGLFAGSGSHAEVDWLAVDGGGASLSADNASVAARDLFLLPHTGAVRVRDGHLFADRIVILGSESRAVDAAAETSSSTVDLQNLWLQSSGQGVFTLGPTALNLTRAFIELDGDADFSVAEGASFKGSNVEIRSGGRALSGLRAEIDLEDVQLSATKSGVFCVECDISLERAVVEAGEHGLLIDRSGVYLTDVSVNASPPLQVSEGELQMTRILLDRPGISGLATMFMNDVRRVTAESVTTRGGSATLATIGEGSLNVSRMHVFDSKIGLVLVNEPHGSVEHLLIERCEEVAFETRRTPVVVRRFAILDSGSGMTVGASTFLSPFEVREGLIKGNGVGLVINDPRVIPRDFLRGVTFEGNGTNF